MNLEVEELIAQNTWTLVKIPPNRKTIKGKWVYKIKTDNDIIRYKAR